MNDDLMFEYLLQMGAMQPEQQELKRKQAMVDALRKSSMQGPEGQMIGKHYVPPSMTQYAAQLGGAYMANKGQQGVDTALRGYNDNQRQMLEELRRRKAIGASGYYQSPDASSSMPIGLGME